jgi:hypothetical protein
MIIAGAGIILLANLPNSDRLAININLMASNGQYSLCPASSMKNGKEFGL